MEADKNIFPKMDILPGAGVVRRVARFVGNLLVPFHTDAAPYMSTHNHGGGPMLDRELYDRQEQHLEQYWQGVLDYEQGNI